MEIYYCDPLKNTECKKSSCRYLGKGECTKTTREEYRRDPTIQETAEAINGAFKECISALTELFTKQKDNTK